MKKILSAVILLTVFASASFGAVSGDVYVRQDVFDARMESLRTEIQLGDERILSEIRAMNAKFEAKFEALEKRIDDLQANTNARIEDTNRRIDDLKTSTSNQIDDLRTSTSNQINDLKTSTSNQIDDLKTVVYWGISIIGLMVAFAIFAPSLGEFLKNFRKPSVSLDDVRELIAQELQAFETRLTPR